MSPFLPVHLRTEAEAAAWRAGISEGMRRARGGAEPAAVPEFDPVQPRYRRRRCDSSLIRADMRAIYAFAPSARQDAEDEEEEMEESEDIAALDDLGEAEAAAVWSAAQAHLSAALDEDLDEDEPLPGLAEAIAEALRRVRERAKPAAPGPASPPDVSPTSSTSAPSGPGEEGTAP